MTEGESSERLMQLSITLFFLALQGIPKRSRRLPN
jgi:hypothetical protein